MFHETERSRLASNTDIAERGFWSGHALILLFRARPTIQSRSLALEVEELSRVRERELEKPKMEKGIIRCLPRVLRLWGCIYLTVAILSATTVSFVRK